MKIDFSLETSIVRTPRVIQMEGMFDVPSAQKTKINFSFNAPIEEKPWKIGLIVGPSGAGKSSVMKKMFPNDAIVTEYEWPENEAVIDGFGSKPTKEITTALSSVGFSSPPSWLKPYRVLSNGEKFRTTMARALTDERPLVVLDEYSSVVDRQAAQIGSWALQKNIRSKQDKQFVAVTCHYDVIEWLQPDWVLQPHLGSFEWRFLQRRPTVEMQICRADYQAWRWFSSHHYLSADLHKAAKCFVGLIDNKLAAFAGLLYFPHPKAKTIWSLSRLVVLPEFQGLGIGAYGFTENIGKICASCGLRLRVHPSHPALIKTWAASKKWKIHQVPSFGQKPGKNAKLKPQETRKVAHLEWVGGGFEDEKSRNDARIMFYS